MSDMSKFSVMSFALALLPVLGGADPAPETLDPHLEAFRPFLNKTWKGEFKESTPEKPMFDVSRYERAMNGKAIRSLHSVNDGMYGGETLIYWDSEKKSLAFFYLTTAGFRTEGTMVAEKNKFTALEKVVGNANGITQVKGVAELLPDGTMHVKAEYLANDKWGPGRDMIYRHDPKASVVFK